MKTLLSTTALAMVLGFPTLGFAQTTAPAANPNAQTQGGEMAGFLAIRGASDLFASDLMGHDVYARRAPAAATTQPNAQMDRSQVRTGEMARMNRADLDGMEVIGQINEIILSGDGEMRALVIGVGGFLGMGERDVAVTMDQVRFAVDAEDPSQMHIVLATAADRLQGSPAYDRRAARPVEALRTEAAGASRPTATASPAERTAFTAPQMQREGYNRVVVTDVSAEMLTGLTVYGVNDNSIGEIEDLIIDEAGAITDVIIDFGGFLGFGTSQVSVGFEEITILSRATGGDVRVYVDATKEQIQARPQYRAVN